MSFLLEVSIERGSDNRGSGRSGRGSGGTGSNRGGGGGRGGNYPRNQHHQQGQNQSGGGGGGGRGVGRGWVPTKTGDQQRGNRPGQRGQGGGAYRSHQHGGKGVGPTRVESSVVGGGGGAGGGRGGRPWGPTFVPGQSQPRSLPGPVIPNIQSLEISEQKPQSTLLDALQEISLFAAKVLVTKLISSLKPNV